MEVIRYSAALREEWDNLVKSSRNGTFLFERQFMDYHADRFEDLSLLFARNGKVIAVLPCTSHGDSVVSHGGLTYGGFILANSAHAVDVQEMLDEAVEFYSSKNYKSLTIKPIPSIYHSQCSDEELYWLFRKGAVLSGRGLSSAVELTAPLPFSTLRKRKLNKAKASALTIQQNISVKERNLWAKYWDILTQVLEEQHSKKPVHTLEEINLLKSRFPEKIQLWGILDKEGEIVGGTVLFITQTVVHAQYIAASHEGKDKGALDLLFHGIVDHFSFKGIQPHAKETFHQPRFLDFGISTEEGGAYLNEGLIFQKEGFGARSVVYDFYTLAL